MKRVVLFIFVMTLCTFGFSLKKPYIGFPGEEPFNDTLLYDQPYDHVPFDWPTSTPAEQGLEPYILSVAYEKADELGFMYSVLVIRNGYLVTEQYFNGQDEYAANNIASVSKSFIGALIGIALKENYLTSLDQKMLDFFPEYITPDLDPRKYDITIRHLLQFRAGLPYDPSRSWMRTPDWMKNAIEQTLVANPGEKFAYSTASTHILSGILTKSTGMSSLEFAERYLFNPLNITIGKWAKPYGYYAGGFGMFFTPRNMARFGYLYLNNGLVDGKQIVTVKWVEDSLKVYSFGDLISYGVIKNWGYGYQWDIGRLRDYDVYYRLGTGGQLIFNIPELNMVLVTTADSDVYAAQSDYQVNSVYNLIANYILPAADGNHETTPYPPPGINGTRVENRSLFLTEYIDILRWEPNPLNEGESISKYRIYYYTDESGTMTKVLLVEVNAGTTEYWFRNVQGDNNRTYGIASVTYDNRESIPAAITVR